MMFEFTHLLRAILRDPVATVCSFWVFVVVAPNDFLCWQNLTEIRCFNSVVMVLMVS